MAISHMHKPFREALEDEELYRVLLDAPFEGIAIHIDGKIIEANAELQRMTGFDHAQLLNKHALELFAPQSRDLVLDKIRQGNTEPYEALGLHQSGKTFAVQIRGKAIQFRGQLARMVAARDITEFKAVESALRESEQRFHDFARSGSDWFWEMGPDLRFTYISERFDELTGRASQGMIGLTRQEIATAEQLAQNPQKWAQHFSDLQARRPFTNFEYEFTHGPGAELFISLNGVPIFAPDGTFLGYRGTGSDVTRRKCVEAQLEHSERELRTIIDNMPDIFYRTDREGRIIAFSPVAVDVMGYSADELMGMKMADCYVNPEDRQIILAQIIAGNGRPVMVESVLRRKDGSTFVVSTHSFVRFDENGEIIGVEGIARDISESKKVEQNLLDAKRRAEDANMAKTRFLAAASHDLRQPLQAINLYLAVLSGKSLDADMTDVIQHIEGSVGALNKLLESLLDISRLEAGLIQAESSCVSLGGLLDRLGNEFGQICRDKGLDFAVVPTRMRVRTDPVLLENILRNLLANAVKYTHRGKVLLGCRRHHGAEGKSQISIEVWDTGEGIEALHLPRIFEEFYQVGNQGRNRNKGLGLGLSIVEKMTKVIGGTVAARSWAGRGSAFSLTLQTTSAHLKASIDAAEIVEQIVHARSIVVIDDDPGILTGLSMFLRSQGHRVTSLCCVTCERCRKAIETMPLPEIIVADYRLQEGRTGVDAVGALRTFYKAEVPAIILTGDTAPERLSEVMNSGLPILHKPIEAAVLHGAIRRLLEG